MIKEHFLSSVVNKMIAEAVSFCVSGVQKEMGWQDFCDGFTKMRGKIC